MLELIKNPFTALIKSIGRRIEKRRFFNPPVFIGGCARSGTTLLLSVLSAHEEIFACPKELGLFNQMIQKKERLEPKRIDRVYRCMIMNRIPPEANRWCEKSPNNIRSINEIDQYYNGNFRFIQVVRDGRDIILSRHPRNRNKYWVEPERWIRDVSAGLQYAGHSKVYTIRYEDLINDFTNTIGGICDFLGIARSENIFNWHKHARVRDYNALYAPVQEINSQSIAKWQKPENEKRVRELTDQPVAIELLRYYHYPLD